MKLCILHFWKLLFLSLLVSALYFLQTNMAIPNAILVLMGFSVFFFDTRELANRLSVVMPFLTGGNLICTSYQLESGCMHKYQ